VRFAHAQPRPKVIGALNPYIRADVTPDKERFVQAMRELGYVHGTHFVIVERFADGKNDLLREFAEELAKLKVDLIIAASRNAVMAAQRATTTIPIVFVAVADPVEAGFADSLAHPGRNITGVSNFNTDLTQKRLQLLTQMVPGLARVAVLANPTNPFYPGLAQNYRALAEPLALQVMFVSASKPEELEPAFKSVSEFHRGAISVMADPFLWNQRRPIAELALRSRLPSISSFAECTEAGGLMSYGASSSGAMSLLATYVDKIFKGAKAGDLPIEQATRLDLVINRKTANALQLTIPRVLLLQAERVIE
jgi:putative ABC transport system substrate-binding protein